MPVSNIDAYNLSDHGDEPEKEIMDTSQPPKPMKTREEAVAKWVNRDVVLEGTFPIPTPSGQVAYAPARGRLTEVFAGGFMLMEEGDDEETAYMFENIRSLHPVSSIAKPAKQLVIPGRSA